MRIFLLAIAFYAPTLAAEPLAEWSNSDKWLLGSALGLLAIDWRQSRDIAKRTVSYYDTPACADPATRPLGGPCTPVHRPQYEETNPLLPKHPTVRQVDTYFGLVFGGTVIASSFLPAEQRRLLIGGLVVVETIVVLRNHQIGVRISF